MIIQICFALLHINLQDLSIYTKKHITDFSRGQDILEFKNF